MHLAEIWRYPVKSTAGEQLGAASLGPLGIPGDRLVHVRDSQGVLTSRRHHRLLGLHSTVAPDGTILLDGHPWHSEAAAQLVRAAVGDAARLAAYDGPERFDVLPLLVASDGALRDWGGDSRRLRANLVIGGVDGLAEFDWPGRVLRVGEEAVIGVHSRRARCVMTTFHPDTLEQDKGVLVDIRRRYGGELALNCLVVQPGLIEVGMPVEVVARGT